MRRTFLLLLLCSSAAWTACESGSNAGEDKATSNSIDSVKATGAAPVQYGGDDPADDTVSTTGTNERVIQVNDGLDKQHPYSGTRPGGAGSPPNPMPSPNTAPNQGMQSNTTDARTSSGSARGTDSTGGRSRNR